MRIIVEWCDWTWKTTLINFLQSKLWREVIKTSQPKTNNPFNEYMQSYEDSKNKNVIFDRMRIWEKIYWPIYRWKSWISLSQESTLLNLTIKDLYIICSTWNPTIRKIFRERWEDFTREQDVVKINWEFRKFYWQYKHLWNIVLYNFQKEWKNLEEFYSYINDVYSLQ